MKLETRINQRLEKLRGYVEILNSLQGVNAQELRNDVDKRAKAERFLQLSIEACIDIAEIVISLKNFPTPQTAGEAIRILGKQGVLEENFAEEFSKAAGMRNILIHDYLDIDYKQVADKINNKLGDFEVFAQAVAKFLEN